MHSEALWVNYHVKSHLRTRLYVKLCCVARGDEARLNSTHLMRARKMQPWRTVQKNICIDKADGGGTNCATIGNNQAQQQHISYGLPRWQKCV